MNSEITINNSETVWDNYDVATDAIYKKGLLIAIGGGSIFAVTLETAILALLDPTPFRLRWAAYSVVNLTPLLVPYFKEQLSDKRMIPFIALSMLILVVALRGFGMLLVFEGMFLLSGSLQTKGLTNERYMELLVGNVKKNIALDEPIEDWLMIPVDWLKKGTEGYCQIIFRWGHDRHLSIKDMADVLNTAYSYKKILTFSYSFLGPWPASRGLSSEEVQRKNFELSVDYLINCKRNHYDLDEAFINEQLRHLIYFSVNLDKPSEARYVNPHLYISHGRPIIMSDKGLGDITELKQKLEDAFGEVTQIR